MYKHVSYGTGQLEIIASTTSAYCGVLFVVYTQSVAKWNREEEKVVEE